MIGLFFASASPSQDMMMFTQQETLFVALPDNFVTGKAELKSVSSQCLDVEEQLKLEHISNTLSRCCSLRKTSNRLRLSEAKCAACVVLEQKTTG